MTSKKAFLELPHRNGSIELSYWLHLFDSPYCKVEITEDGRYYLTARRLDKISETEHIKMQESVKKLTTTMTAIAKIELNKDFQSIEPVDAEEPDITIVADKSVYLYPKHGAECEASPLANFTNLDEHGRPVKQERQERWYDFYLDQCDDWIDRTVMFKVLDYFAKRTTPFSLWWTYETVENDEGSRDAVKKLDNLTKKELSLFTESLDRYDMEGHGRHAKDPKRPYNRPKMSLSEARTFLASRILKPWLIKKQEIYRPLTGGSSC